MRRQIAAAITLAALIAGAPARPHAGVIATEVAAVVTAPPVVTGTKPASEPSGLTLAVAPTNDGGRVFLDTDASGGVTLLPIRMLVPSPSVGDATAGPTDAAGSGRCDEAGCGIAPDWFPFAVGTAAFQVGNFIGNAVAAARFIYASSAVEIAPGGYGMLGMVGMGNFALVAIGLIGLALTRRRDHIPPG